MLSMQRWCLLMTMRLLQVIVSVDSCSLPRQKDARSAMVMILSCHHLMILCRADRFTYSTGTVLSMEWILKRGHLSPLLLDSILALSALLLEGILIDNIAILFCRCLMLDNISLRRCSFVQVHIKLDTAYGIMLVMRR